MSGANPGSARRRYPVELALLALGASALAGSSGCAKSPAEIVNGHPWQVTVYYTAVESLHTDPPVPVQGCATRHCKNGDQDLGAYPQSFVSAVHEEGTGRITSGPNTGMYLNWSDNIGFWLDSTTRDAHGRPTQISRTIRGGSEKESGHGRHDFSPGSAGPGSLRSVAGRETEGRGRGPDRAEV